MLKVKLAVLALGALAATAAFAQEPRTDRSPAALTGRDTTFLIVYNQPGLSGSAFTYALPTGNLSSMQGVGSVRTVGGAWEVCDRHEYRGECRVIDGRYLSLSRTGLREIRSIRPVQDAPAG